MTSTQTGTFRFLDLPGELRNRVYFHMLRPVACLKDLTGYTSDWFNPAILGTSRQIYYEASSIIYKHQITVVVDPMAMACCIKGLHRLPQKSRFRRCGVDIDLSDPRLTAGAQIKTLEIDPKKKVTDIIHLLVEDLKEMKFLEQLHLSCKRTTYVIRPRDHTGFAIPIFPANTMDCFRKLRGLKKIVIEGDLGEKYVASLLKYMNKPPVNLSTTARMIGVVDKSHCRTCSWVVENYIQVTDSQIRRESRYPLDAGQILDMQYPA